MARLLRRRPSPKKVKALASDDVGKMLADEFSIAEDKVVGILRSVGINMGGRSPADEMDLYREVIACKVGDWSRFLRDDAEYEELLDRQLRSFDEIYVDTAPIIHKDWFLHFVSDAAPILKRRKKRLIILEKTMEELHGLKDNPEKDKEVRIRATIRPDLIRALARKGLVRIGDTGSSGIADDHLVQLFSKLGKRENLLLITQDRGLSERIVELAHTLSTEPMEKSRTSFLHRLFGGKDTAENQNRHLMMVCKLVEGGALKRCYVCPECKESYYDDVLDCDGKLLCSKCCLALQKQDAKRDEERRQQEILIAKQEEERQRQEKLEEQNREMTVQQALDRRKRKASLIAFLGLAVIVSVLLLVM